MLESILEKYNEEEFLIADGFNDAIIGVDESRMVLIYSVKECIEVLVREGMDYLDADEHFHYNVSGGYVGNKTPVWCNDM